MDITNIVINVVKETFGRIYVDEECPLLSKETLLSELMLDSLRIVEVIFELETKLNVQADESELGELKSLGDVIAMFEKSTA